jgi:hypothetical protein
MTVCRLHHKTDGEKTAWNMHQDLTTCVWKQIALGFSSLTLRLTHARLRVVHVASSRRLRRVEPEDRWADAMGCVRPLYPKIIFFVLDNKGIVVF